MTGLGAQMAGGPQNLLQERLAGLWEVVIGMLLMSAQAVSHHMDQIISGAHTFAAFAGAIIGAHGLWRIVKRRRKRRTDHGDDV